MPVRLVFMLVHNPVYGVNVKRGMQTSITMLRQLLNCLNFYEMGIPIEPTKVLYLMVKYINMDFAPRFGGNETWHTRILSQFWGKLPVNDTKLNQIRIAPK